ncbi:LytTR family transcriptional regulator [Spirosoma aureum]|uniref:LytTR family transcriptional regulator n=1 Tax=Spirosoma aureum TaxID=2692134 RepID=A0A6G9APG1_9BACT|nr:LytTR family DNA-binding domain-containing protein [Spirosoma aureum]QIP14382.1 LytTR family transcriptional regulator [Spirosoma aureum]
MTSIQYPDKIARLIGIPIWAVLFRLIGDPASLGDLVQSPIFYQDVAVVTLVTGLLWALNRWLIREMDRRYSWATQPLQRLLIQGGISLSGTILIITVFSLVYNNLILQRPAPFNLSITISNDVPIGCLFIVLLHMAYTMYWMVSYHRLTVAALQNRIVALEHSQTNPVEQSESRSQALKTLLVNHGKAFVPVATEQVAYVFITNEISIVKTADNKSFTVDATLEQLSERLPETSFFRLNRQFVVNRQAIRRVENDGAGRLLLHLQPTHADEVAVSRRRVAEFRRWMEQ